MLVALVAPIALAYLHFIVLTDSPWGMTWGGLLLGGMGSILLLTDMAVPGAAVVAGAGYGLIGLAFIVNPGKPTPPGVFSRLPAPRVVSADQRYGKRGRERGEHRPRRTRSTAKTKSPT